MDYKKMVQEKQIKQEEKHNQFIRLKNNYQKLWKLTDEELRIESLGGETGGRNYLLNSDPGYVKILEFFNTYKGNSKEFYLTRDIFQMLNKRELNSDQYSFLEKVSAKEFKKLARHPLIFDLKDLILHYNP